MLDRRKSLRVPLRGKVVFELDHELCEAEIMDASENGLSVEVVCGRLIQGRSYRAQVTVYGYFEALPLCATVIYVARERVGLHCTAMGFGTERLFKTAVSDALVSRAVSYDRFAQLSFL